METDLQNKIRDLELGIRIEFSEHPVAAQNLLVMDDHPESIELRNDLAGLAWTQVPDAVLKRHAMALPLLSQLGFEYYVSAYLVLSLRLDGGDVVDPVIYAICPSSLPRWNWRFGHWPGSKKRVVAAWLRLVLENPVVFGPDELVGRKGYQNYWRGWDAGEMSCAPSGQTKN